MPLFDFTLRKVVLATDDDGDPVDSCVIEATPPKPADAAAKDTPAQKAFRQAYNSVVLLARQGPDVPLDDVGDQFKEFHVTGKSDRDAIKEAKRQAWKHAREKIPAGLRVWQHDGKDWIGPEPKDVVYTDEVDVIDGENSERR